MIIPGYSPVQCGGHDGLHILPLAECGDVGYDNTWVLPSAMWRPCRPSYTPNGGKGDVSYDNTWVLPSAMWRPCRPSYPPTGERGWTGRQISTVGRDYSTDQFGTLATDRYFPDQENSQSLASISLTFLHKFVVLKHLIFLENMF
jgi:hypothetical protein